MSFKQIRTSVCKLTWRTLLKVALVWSQLDIDFDNKLRCYPRSGHIIRGAGVRLPRFASQLLSVWTLWSLPVKWQWIRKQIAIIHSCAWFIGNLGWGTSSTRWEPFLLRYSSKETRTEWCFSIGVHVYPRMTLFCFLKLTLHSLLTAASTLWTLRRQVRLCSMLCMPTESRKWWLLRKWKMLFKINISSGIWETHRFLSSSRIVAQVRSEKGNQTLGKSYSSFLPLLLARREVRALKQLPQPQSMVRSGMVGREHEGCSYSGCRCLAWGEAQQPQSSAPRQEQKHARLSQSLCSFIKVKLHVSDALFRFYILGC